MKTYTNKYSPLAILTLLFVLLLSLHSCNTIPEDDYKKYVEGGEINYTGKLDSVKTYSGKDRILLTGILQSDPKVKQVIVFYNNGVDSTIVPVVKTDNIDTVNIDLANCFDIEGLQNMIVYTVDGLGNRSIPVYAIGTTYGSRYESGLINRPISSALVSTSGTLTITWGSVDLTSGMVATELTYTGSDNNTYSVSVDPSETSTVINGYKANSKFQYYTSYIPTETTIDTFKTASTNYLPAFDITYMLLNPQSPFDATNKGDRWGVLTGWTTNAAAKCMDNNTRGGWDGWNSLMVFESGWGSPRFTNGKIYQTITLPPGKYSFIMHVALLAGRPANEQMLPATYFVVSQGSEIPDVEAVETNSLSYYRVTNKSTVEGQAIAMDFELKVQTQVSMGMVATMDSGDTALRIGGVNLYSK